MINTESNTVTTIVPTDGRSFNYVRNGSNKCDRRSGRYVPHLNKYVTISSSDKLSCELTVRWQNYDTYFFIRVLIIIYKLFYYIFAI